MINLFDPSGHSPRTIAVNFAVGAASSTYVAAGLPMDVWVAIATIIYLALSTVAVAPKAWSTVKTVWAKVVTVWNALHSKDSDDETSQS